MSRTPALKPASRHEIQRPASSSLKHSLHARSLRDLRSSLPPKSPSSIKSRHRAVRVLPSPSGIHMTPGWSPGSLDLHASISPLSSSLPSLPPSNTSKTVKIRGGRHSRMATAFHVYPTSNQQHEPPPQVPGATARPKRATDFQIPAQLRRMYSDNTLSICELRQPPTNPMTTRHCTDFNLDGTGQGLITPSILNTSMASTPLAMYTETDSDASSSCETTQLDFPHPPDPISPLLLLEDILPKDANKQYIDTKFRKFLAAYPDRSLLHGYWSLNAGADMYLTDVRHDLELVGEELLDRVNPLTHFQNELEPHALRKGFTPYVNGSHQLLHVRSASSILPTCTSHTNPIKAMRFRELDTKLERPSVESLDSLQRLGPNLRKFESFDRWTQIPPIKSNTEPRSTTFIDPPRVIVPSLASAGRRRPTRHVHLPVPLTGLGLSSTSDPSTDSGPLASPFHHRVTKSQPMVQTSNVKRGEVQDPTSFMDITPEHKDRDLLSSTHKEKLRKLLARASSNVISWGKNLTNTNRQK